MSKQIKNEIKVDQSTQELTNWQKIDQLEAEIEKSKKKKKRRGGMRFRRIFGDTVGQVVLTILSIIWIIPLIYLFVQSFRKEPGAWSPTFFPQEWTLDNYKRLFTETKFLQWYGNTLLIAVCSCVITAIFVLSVAYVFSRMKFKARKPMMNKRSCAKAGIQQEIRKREHYEKPSVRRKKKSEAARKRKYN